MRTTRNRSAGITLPELLIVVAAMGLLAYIGALGWQEVRSRTEATSTARLAKVMLHQARMQAVYLGVNHFLVYDSDSNSFEIFKDSGSDPGLFDATDERTSRNRLTSGVHITLPALPTSLTNPIDATTLVAAWSLPASDTGGAWGSTRKGVLVTPRGLIQSATATPQPISSGVIVFTNARDETSAVTVRGRLGDIRSFHLRDGQWREL